MLVLWVALVCTLFFSRATLSPWVITSGPLFSISFSSLSLTAASRHKQSSFYLRTKKHRRDGYDTFARTGGGVVFFAMAAGYEYGKTDMV